MSDISEENMRIATNLSPQVFAKMQETLCIGGSDKQADEAGAQLIAESLQAKDDERERAFIDQLTKWTVDTAWIVKEAREKAFQQALDLIPTNWLNPKIDKLKNQLRLLKGGAS